MNNCPDSFMGVGVVFFFLIEGVTDKKIGLDGMYPETKEEFDAFCEALVTKVTSFNKHPEFTGFAEDLINRIAVNCEYFLQIKILKIQYGGCKCKNQASLTRNWAFRGFSGSLITNLKLKFKKSEIQNGGSPIWRTKM